MVICYRLIWIRILLWCRLQNLKVDLLFGSAKGSGIVDKSLHASGQQQLGGTAAIMYMHMYMYPYIHTHIHTYWYLCILPSQTYPLARSEPVVALVILEWIVTYHVNDSTTERNSTTNTEATPMDSFPMESFFNSSISTPGVRDEPLRSQPCESLLSSLKFDTS